MRVKICQGNFSEMAGGAQDHERECAGAPRVPDFGKRGWVIKDPTSAKSGQMWGTVQAREDVGHQPGNADTKIGPS